MQYGASGVGTANANTTYAWYAICPHLSPTVCMTVISMFLLLIHPPSPLAVACCPPPNQTLLSPLISSQPSGIHHPNSNVFAARTPSLSPSC